MRMRKEQLKKKKKTSTKAVTLRMSSILEKLENSAWKSKSIGEVYYTEGRRHIERIISKEFVSPT